MTTSTIQDNVCVLTIEGELNKSTVGQFQELVDAAVVESTHDFVIDLVDCTGVDSAGLEAFTQLHRECQERLGMCKICTLSESLEKILEVTRLSKQLELCVTLEEAMAALN